VFKAQLYGPMKETTGGGHRHISIVDMQADVFRALLHFNYTDAVLLGLDDDDLGREGSK
jgi:speckle-type POZ protein